jgi:hypothetical protein
VDIAVKRGAPKESLMTAKHELISKPAAESLQESGGKSDPEKYNSILIRAIAVITEMCRLLSDRNRETWAEAWGKALEKLTQLAIERVGIRMHDPVKDIRNNRDAR